ncbi:uncharacterized protein LOC123508412 [Portunus trituberculatus]|uniref:uncharacterized protein LOC123508412 n=1 Tax=Portunus trituberculatus TaxID=210409 RepID=UPI001E1CEC3A|nr:uncharacterized protein LOC123508412 [Portunus trituberculatus]
MADFKGTTTLLLLLAATTVVAKFRNSNLDISRHCDEETMVIEVRDTGNIGSVAVKGFDFIDACRAQKNGDIFFLELSPNGIACGCNSVREFINWPNRRRYSTMLLIKLHNGQRFTQNVECIVNDREKRDVLPPEFIEPDFIEITSEVSGTAPIPILNVGVRQNGQLVGGQINVRPGTPLTMEVFLDDVSANIYGILMHNMEVTDMANKRETIIFNGCSVDPVLFDNFVTTTGDYVSAKFRAFKFPETNYVLFRGTVDVCLDKCQGIACSNGQVGYGRRRRGIDDEVPDPNKIFEVTMMTILKIEEPLNGTMSLEKRLAEEVQNQVAEELKTMELALQEMKEERMLMEQALREEANPWRRPAVVSVIGEDRAAMQSSEGREPGYIYYNSAETLSQSFLMVGVTAGALLALRV